MSRQKRMDPLDTAQTRCHSAAEASYAGARTKRRSVRTSSGEQFQAPAPPDAAAEQPQLCEPQIRRLRLSRCLSDPPAASDGEAAGCSGQALAMAASNAAPAPRSSGADVPEEISAGGDPGSPMPVILSSDLAASAAPSIGTAAGTSARSADVASDGFPSAQARGPEDEVDTTDDDCVVLEDDGRESVSVATDDEGGTDSEVGSDLSEITLGADVPEEVMAICDDVFETPKPLKVEYDDAGACSSHACTLGTVAACAQAVPGGSWSTDDTGTVDLICAALRSSMQVPPVVEASEAASEAAFEARSI